MRAVFHISRRFIAAPRPFKTSAPDWILRGEQFHFTGADRYIRKLCDDRLVFRDFVPRFTPIIDARVSFGSTKLICGSAIDAEITASQPDLKFHGPDALFTVVMTDLDYPSNYRPAESELLLWKVCNIRGGDLSTGDVSCEYVGPCPPENSGSHRIGFLLARQTEKLEPTAVIPATTLKGRKGFNTTQFVVENKLVPTSVLFFQSKFDQSVNDIYAQVGVSSPSYIDPKKLNLGLEKPRVVGSRYRNQHL
eukprot:c4062_g2_i1.p1 GENE.c4062_g2_i1~~c4062_g2_i1.p1  ORF type:complete len:250 (+),score=55.11 c4062_g2_i1:43-792(+)